MTDPVLALVPRKYLYWRLPTPINCIPHPYWMYSKSFSTLRCSGWAYGYTHMPYYMCRRGWILGEMGYGQACMMLWCHGWGWKPPIECIPHPYWMYANCFITLRCCGWACGCILIAVLHVQVGVNFRNSGVWPSLYEVVVSWMRLQTFIDCIPHPYWMYTKCFSTLRCCGWAYHGCTLSWVPSYAVIHCAGGGKV